MSLCDLCDVEVGDEFLERGFVSSLDQYSNRENCLVWQHKYQHQSYIVMLASVLSVLCVVLNKLFEGMVWWSEK